MRLLAVLVSTILAALAVGCVTTPPPLGGRVYEGVVVEKAGEVALERESRSRTVRGNSRLLVQLSRLVGARVGIRGSVRGRDELLARDFSIIDSGSGSTPHVGVVVVDQSGIVLQDELTGTALSLRGEALRTLRTLHGARLWVDGVVVGPRQILVGAYGVLLDPTEQSTLR